MSIANQVAQYRLLIRVDDVLDALASAINSVPDQIIARLEEVSATTQIAVSIAAAETKRAGSKTLSSELAAHGLSSKTYLDDVLKEIETHVRSSMPTEVGEYIKDILDGRPLVGSGKNGPTGHIASDILTLVDAINQAAGLQGLSQELSKRLLPILKLEDAMRRSLTQLCNSRIIPMLSPASTGSSRQLALDGTIERAVVLIYDEDIIPLLIRRLSPEKVIAETIGSEVALLQRTLELITGIEQTRHESPALAAKVEDIGRQVEEMNIEYGKLKMGVKGVRAVLGLLVVCVVVAVIFRDQIGARISGGESAGHEISGKDGARSVDMEAEVKRVEEELEETQGHVIKLQEQFNRSLDPDRQQKRKMK